MAAGSSNIENVQTVEDPNAAPPNPESVVLTCVADVNGVGASWTGGAGLQTWTLMRREGVSGEFVGVANGNRYAQSTRDNFGGASALQYNTLYQYRLDYV